MRTLNSFIEEQLIDPEFRKEYEKLQPEFDAIRKELDNKTNVELWDAYDRNQNKLGFDLVRGEAIPEGAYHLVCDTVVRHTDGDYLIMQRDFNKKVYPGFYEVGAGGSVLKGESPLEGAVRELAEESGIIAKPEDLTQIHLHVSDKTQSIYYKYLCVTDCPKDSITLQEGETIDYKWLSKDEFLAFMDSDKCIDVERERLREFLDTLR